MKLKEVLQLLQANKNERGIAHWARLGDGTMKSFGLGVTQLRQLGKKIGKDHKLALELWESDYYDARIIATIVDDPKLVTPRQVDSQIKGSMFWMLAYAYCGNLLSRTTFAAEKAGLWVKSKDDLLRRCGYLLLYELAKTDPSWADSYFEPFLATIAKKLQSEENFVKDAMNNALFAIGRRSAPLNKRAIDIARKIGRVEVDYGDNSCQAIDCVRHLTSPALRKKLKS